VEIIASMAIVAAQLAGMPILSVPAGLLVAASYVIGSRLAHSADGGIPAGLVLGSQAVVAALVMVVGMRAERAAVRAFTNLEQEQAASALGTAQRDEERAQLRLVHSGPLTTLAMALHANAGYLAEVVRQRAAASRQDLLRLSAPTSPIETTARLDERLAQVVMWYQSMLKITSLLPECSVPVDTAEAFARAVAEALENVVRHAQTERAWIELRDHGHAVQVTVTDRGRGFDLGQASAFGFGLREDLSGRMVAVGGIAAVMTSPGAGTVVQLEWCRD
jgi:histidine kinase/DNA gyrase B/HSP90-like ATPase